MPARIAATSSYSFKQLLNFPHKVWVESRHSKHKAERTQSRKYCLHNYSLQLSVLFLPRLESRRIFFRQTRVTWCLIPTPQRWLHGITLKITWQFSYECTKQFWSYLLAALPDRHEENIQEIIRRNNKKFSFQGTVEQLSGDWIFKYTAFSTEEEGGDNEEKKKKM